MRQYPAQTKAEAQWMCEAKLCIDNDSQWHQLRSELRTLEMFKRRLQSNLLRSPPTMGCVLRVYSGWHIEHKLSPMANMQGVRPWFASMFDPTDTCQVEQRVHLDWPMPGGSHRAAYPDLEKARLMHYCLDIETEAALEELKGMQFTGRVEGRMSSSHPNIQSIPKEKPTMSAPITITTKTLINGADIENRSDAELFDIIASEEKKIAELGKIENKPKRLVAEIEKRQAGIAALVAYLDSKE